MPKSQRPKPVPIDWEKIASFYAGRPIKISVDPTRTAGATTDLPESGYIKIGPQVKQGLDEWLRDWRKAKTPAARQGLAALGASWLPILIHESMHNRHFTEGYFDANNPGTGFRNAGNESQAIALGAELIPDLLRRFFGVPIDSPLSRAYAKAAKSRGDYQQAYGR